MKAEERIKSWKLHPSMRGQFGYELYKAMALDERIIIITGDLGYNMFDAHKEDFMDRYYNVGASEQAMMGIAVGMALSGKIPVVYSITNFLLYRPYETIRNYIDHEQIAVKLCGGGRNKEYEHDGFSHWSEDAKNVLDNFPNIIQYWPETNKDMILNLKELLTNDKPCFLSLKR
jgi:transketolase